MVCLHQVWQLINSTEVVWGSPRCFDNVASFSHLGEKKLAQSSVSLGALLDITYPPHLPDPLSLFPFLPATQALSFLFRNC